MKQVFSNGIRFVKKIQDSINTSKQNLQLKVDSLIKNYKVEKDEFSNRKTIYSKKNNEYYPLKKTITVYCNENGLITLRSNYYSTDWLFHSYIKVKIGETIKETEVVPTYSSLNNTYNAGSHIWETVTYSDDNGIVEFIALNVDKEVKIRFEGKQFYSDVALNQNDKLAIKEVWEISNLLKQITQ